MAPTPQTTPSTPRTTQQSSNTSETSELGDQLNKVANMIPDENVSLTTYPDQSQQQQPQQDDVEQQLEEEDQEQDEQQGDEEEEDKKEEIIPTPPDCSPEITEEPETEEELSQPVVNLKRDVNKHLPTQKPLYPIQPLEPVTYDPLPQSNTPKVNKQNSAENLAKNNTPIMTRKKKKTYPTTIKQTKAQIYYDPRSSIVRMGNRSLIKCFPDLQTFMVVITEFLKQDCRLSGQSYRSLSAHLPPSWRQHVLADPCTNVTEKDITDRLNGYIKTYFSNPATRWNTELQVNADGCLKKYQTK